MDYLFGDFIDVKTSAISLSTKSFIQFVGDSPVFTHR